MVPPTRREIITMANIRTLLKNASQVLFSDDEYFNKDITGVKSLKDVKDVIGIRGSLRKGDYYGNKVQYKLNQSYDFTLTIIS
ncbi:hypothetical protein ECO340P2_00021 [Escherichia phage ECO340P2]|nr:hypothetical protein ECO340P2_00021 [Escherichia phage ECO340P2]